MDCKWFKNSHCQSCQLLDREYAETLRLKEQHLLDLFKGEEIVLSPTIGLHNPDLPSRNKAKFAVSQSGDEIAFGFYDSKGNFKLLEECPIHLEGLNELLPHLKIFLKSFNIIPYDLKTKRGEIKYLILSKSETKKELLVRFVLRSKESLDRLKKLAKELVNSHPDVRVVTANIQPEHKAVLEGDEEIILSDEQFITHQFGEICLTLGARSFFQVTPEIAKKLYAKVGSLVQEHAIKSFLDLYCGVGAFAFFAAQSAERVLGVELSKEAIDCAKQSIPLNSIAGNIEFQALDVEAFLRENRPKVEVVMVNPPRRGLNGSIIDSILEISPKYLFYSSCNAETLHRDYQVLKSNYEVIEMQIFDMFPFSHHYETLLILRKIR